MRTFLIAPLLILPLLLSGCVPVILGAAAEVGVTIQQERTFGTAIDDLAILTSIRNKYLQEDVNELTASVSAEVVEGRVLLTGSVTDPATRIRAVRLAWQANGVREVINEIQVNKGRSLGDIAGDGFITSQIKSKLLLVKNIKSINYSIETVNSIVYIIGIAQSQEEMDDVLNIARTIKGVTRVVSHARVKTDPAR